MDGRTGRHLNLLILVRNRITLDIQLCFEKCWCYNNLFNIEVNSLRPIGAYMRHLFFDLRKKLISPPIFVP
jgi:hypothetical protein